MQLINRSPDECLVGISENLYRFHAIKPWETVLTEAMVVLEPKLLMCSAYWPHETRLGEEGKPVNMLVSCATYVLPSDTDVTKWAPRPLYELHDMSMQLVGQREKENEKKESFVFLD